MKKKIVLSLLIMISLFMATGCEVNNPFKSKNDNSNKSNPVSTATPKPTSSDIPPVDKNLKIGEEVAVKGEPFYVFESSDNTKGTVVLIAKYNLTKDGTKQAPNATRNETVVEFSSEAYWLEEAKNYKDWDKANFDLNNVNGNSKGDAITKARDYATSLGAINGRLITYEEVEKMRFDYPVMIGGQENQITENASYLDYYTSSVRSFNLEKVYMVRGEHTPTLEVDSALYGVRPIITISKNLVK